MSAEITEVARGGAAPARPRSRAWKALPGHPSAARAAARRPTGPTAGDRQRPLWTPAWGTSRAWPRTQPSSASNLRGSNPVPPCFAVRGSRDECRVTCDSRTPAVTASVRLRPPLPDAVRTQRGPGPLRPALAPLLTGRGRLRRSEPWRAGTDWLSASILRQAMPRHAPTRPPLPQPRDWHRKPR
jgi:hypothetical protein